jgi:hypothetical protein
MKRALFIISLCFAFALTLTGWAALLDLVAAADGLKSSVITFVIALGFALLGPSIFLAAVFFHRRNDSHRRLSADRVPATPKQAYRPYLHEH